MLPLRDTVRTYSFPLVNLSLIVLNLVVFLYETSLSPIELEQLFSSYGLVPAQLNFSDPLVMIAFPAPLITLLTHLFIHGGWFHFLSNVWILFIFGDNVEDRMGHARYLMFYLTGGVIAGLLQSVINTQSTIPAIGASGAIASVLGAYFVLYPRAKVLSLVFIFLIPWFVEIPALFYLGFWFIAQLFSGLRYLNLLEAANMGGVAWWAHIGGFLFGVFLYRIFTPQIHPAYDRQFPRFPHET